MATLFIADLHLDASRPAITTLFEHYLASDEVRHAQALYILGDLVEAWIGDDDDAELPARIAAATRAVRDGSVTVLTAFGRDNTGMMRFTSKGAREPCKFRTG